MRVGVCILPEDPWPVAAQKWRRAEELGFAHAWTYDHLAWRNLRDSPWYAAVPTLSAAALVTSTIRLGTLVASPNFRHPVSFAREVVALDDVSGGRLTLGLGAGGEGWDATILGQQAWSARERSARFGEFVTLLDHLLCDGDVTAYGAYYTALEARTFPGCIQRPRVPFAIAATGPKGMRLTAEFASTWVTTGARGQDAPLDATAGAASVATQIAQLDAACVAIGRDPATVDRLVLLGLELAEGTDSPDAFAETVAAYAAVSVTDLVVHWPRPDEPFKGAPDALEHLVLPS